MKKPLLAISLLAFSGGLVFGALEGGLELTQFPALESIASQMTASAAEAPAAAAEPAPATSPAAAEGEAAHAVAPAKHRSRGDGSCIADAAAIEDVRRQREELNARAQELNAREAEFKAREKAIEEELKKIAQAREDLGKAQGSRKKEQEENLAKLVETLESMSPKSASQLLSSLEDNLAVTSMSRMSTAKLAKVMNVMEPGRSSKLSEMLAGVIRERSEGKIRKAEPAAAPPTPQAAAPVSKPTTTSQTEKGGEPKHVDSSRNADSSRQPAAAADSR